MESLAKAEVQSKHVIVRVNFDVPLVRQNNQIAIRSDYRIRHALPTLRYLLEHNAKIILLSHLGRPDGKIDPTLSLAPVADYLAKLMKHPVSFAVDSLGIETKRAVSRMEAGQIMMLENLRFHPEEEKNDKLFAQSLASLGQIYINDAFPACHRRHASIVGIPKYLPAYAGFRLLDEVKTLAELTTNPERPFMVLLGGAKLADKIEVLERIIPLADKIILGGGIANTFLAAHSEEISLSMHEPRKIKVAESLLADHHDKLMLPIDWYVDYPSPNTFRILDVGPLSLDLAFTEMRKAKTIFWNGNFGRTEDPRFTHATLSLAKWLARKQTGQKTIVTGGDTVGFIDEVNLLNDMSFVSTGGGASLEFLSGDPLPGVVALDHAIQIPAANQPAEPQTAHPATGQPLPPAGQPAGPSQPA